MASQILLSILFVNLGGYGSVGLCGPAVSFYAMEKRLLEEHTITADNFCSNFDNKEDCKNDEYNVCNWCDQHKSESESTDTSVRCVSASYHWMQCQRRIAPPRKERIKHKFDWDKSKPGDTTLDGGGREESNHDEVAKLKMEPHEGGRKFGEEL